MINGILIMKRDNLTKLTTSWIFKGYDEAVVSLHLNHLLSRITQLPKRFLYFLASIFTYLFVKYELNVFDSIFGNINRIIYKKWFCMAMDPKNSFKKVSSILKLRHSFYYMNRFSYQTFLDYLPSNNSVEQFGSKIRLLFRPMLWFWSSRLFSK